MGAERLAVLLCLSRQMSVALERKEVRTVSDRRVEAIHLVVLSPAFRFKVNLEDILGQGGRWPPESQGRLCYIFRGRTALVFHSSLVLNYISVEACYSLERQM